MLTSLKKLIPTKRRIVQLYAALLYNAHLKGFISGRIYTGNLKYACAPGLNCYSCPGAVAACPIGALQNALSASSKKLPFYVVGIILLYSLILGRTICGYLCPFGLIQELIFKIPSPKIKKSKVTRGLSFLKYVILAVFAILIPLYYGFMDIPLPGFCKFICPAGTLEGAIPLMLNPANCDKHGMLGYLFVLKTAVLLTVILLSVFVFRVFCRFLCPLGAIYGLFSKLHIAGIKLDENKCISCGKCVRTCKMDIRKVGDMECINCGDCIQDCPTGAISFSPSLVFENTNDLSKCAPKRNRTVSFIIKACLILLLPLVIILVNLNGTFVSDTNAATAVTSSFSVGDSVPGFTVNLYNAEDESAAFSYDPENNKVLVINFWATWCGPCVTELPYFEKLADSHPEIDVIAVHSSFVTEDVESFIRSAGYTVPMGKDTDGSVSKLFGCTEMLPQTAVISSNGILIYNSVGSVTYEVLEALVNRALSEN